MLRPLVDTHAYCTAIGAVAMEWASLESIVQGVLWRLAGLDSRKGRCITQHVSFNIIWDSILSLAIEIPLSQKEQEALTTLQKKCDPLRIERNNIVHAVWGITPDGLSKGQLTAIVAKARKQLKIEQHSYSIEYVHEVANKINELSGEIATFSLALLIQPAAKTKQA